ncbi:hypothetical protein B0H16DRAFT_1457447 [Mycena metata]|uniref:Uncharacterized protein n=1 Tax=Mycena metata TaxID=1033252 RepID=A0AAD7JA36_9AGAR|nr:hypothetical protein B0H16DRAFT_1457447 [Mycena metata]
MKYHLPVPQALGCGVGRVGGVGGLVSIDTRPKLKRIGPQAQLTYLLDIFEAGYNPRGSTVFSSPRAWSGLLIEKSMVAKAKVSENSAADASTVELNETQDIETRLKGFQKKSAVGAVGMKICHMDTEIVFFVAVASFFAAGAKINPLEP